MYDINEVKTMVKSYIWSILLAVTIIGGIVTSFLLLGVLNPVIAAIGGLLFSVPIRFFWLAYTSPIITIKGTESTIINFGDMNSTPQTIIWEYEVYRIIIQNKGRSAAKNCKGYIVIGEGKERVCWTVPAERPNATINARDDERIDFCAFYRNGEGTVPIVIAPTEEGWLSHPDDCRDLKEIKKCKVLITADNASPIEADIVINEKKMKIEIK